MLYFCAVLTFSVLNSEFEWDARNSRRLWILNTVKSLITIVESAKATYYRYTLLALKLLRGSSHCYSRFLTLI